MECRAFGKNTKINKILNGVIVVYFLLKSPKKEKKTLKTELMSKCLPEKN